MGSVRGFGNIEGVVLLAVVGGCVEDREASAEPYDPETASSSSAGSFDDTEGKSVTGVAGEDGESTSSSTSGDPPSSTGDPTPVDCEPAWVTPWIGSPCATDEQCSYDGGICLREDEGFPCGTCSLDCDEFCPDEPQTPQTFCVDANDLELSGAAGLCVSRCDPGLLGGNGCRDGYACQVLERFGESSASTGVCIPIELVDDATSRCHEELLELGVVFAPVEHEAETPAGHPNLSCTIDDAVLVYGPIGGVDFISGSGQDVPLRVSCDTAISLAGTASVAAMDGATALIHFGTYNCRVIAGTQTLSTHGLGDAIDIGGFILEDGTELSVFFDWEDGLEMPETQGGQWLRSFTDQLWAMGLWNIILTPEYNDAHDDHFHVDRTLDGNTYE